jgi:hypothetical protein
LMRHTRYEQQLRCYHDRNVRERSFNVGDMVLRHRWHGSLIRILFPRGARGLCPLSEALARLQQA